MTYLLAEVSALVNAQPLASRPAPTRTWRDRATAAEAQQVLAAVEAYAVFQVGAALREAL